MHKFRPGQNCWRIERADYVSVLVDYGNYYRDLHESIVKARKSIFVLGWDIDSRIELLRGHDAEESDYPTTFFDLICWKARQNPDLQIYLNKWDYSLFFMRQREPMWNHKWAACNLPNIHYCMDNVLPLGGCHHQKIAIIDDEVAYWGGMDVALGRWDFRDHSIINDDRADPAQLPHLTTTSHFAPYHDIQAVAAGPIVSAFADLVRMRWQRACPDVEPMAFEPNTSRELPHTWPDTDPPDFENVDMAIARTLPRLGKQPQVEEVARLLVDEIGMAENFIYIENQYLAAEEIARALNKRLRERPNLRVLAVSCHTPQGAAERESMWAARVDFADIARAGGVEDRMAIAYPACHENDEVSYVHIHSKLMAIDDRLLHIGSANFNNRSMGLDTECDAVIIGNDEKSRAKIADVRNDLIREHTGYEIAEIAQVIDGGEPVGELLKQKYNSHQYLHPVYDEPFRRTGVMKALRKVADPRRPIVPAHYTHFLRRIKSNALKSRVVWGAVAFVALGILISMLWSHTPLAQYADMEHLKGVFEQVRNSPLALMWIILIYIAGGLLFFPVTAMSAAVIMIFGGVKGFAFSLIGSLISGLIGYAIGRRIGKDRLQRFFPQTGKVVGKIKDSGVIGVTVIRTLPLAPFSLMNMVLGVVNIPVLVFCLGTVLGLAPGKIMLAIFGESLSEVVSNPDPQNILYACLGLAGWLSVILICNKLARGWQARQEQMA